jgi:hypothetical protein
MSRPPWQILTTLSFVEGGAVGRIGNDRAHDEPGGWHLSAIFRVFPGDLWRGTFMPLLLPVKASFT